MVMPILVDVSGPHGILNLRNGLYSFNSLNGSERSTAIHGSVDVNEEYRIQLAGYPHQDRPLHPLQKKDGGRYEFGAGREA
jgi:hypothetical protein